ncbi:F-box/kelch-repeat protein At3g06240-like [Rutidosis leptorrhynchoides]|uniref:F-box/kelch-repeat protein At3g06240-like n=1 Tax=Rutidosis leptorrhynchoides TaxID=125765 RepID=UPI003A99D0FC
MSSLYFISFDHHEETKEEEEESIPTKLHLQVPDLIHSIYGSCNGLVLLHTFGHWSDHQTLVVSNPTTREFVQLPDCDFKIEGHRNTWTRVIDYPDKYHSSHITSKAFVNGSFHSVATKVSDQTKVIVAFSLADENFSEVPSPTLSYDLDTFCRLCVVDEKLAIFSWLDAKVWLMNEYGVKGSWTTILLHGLNEIPMIRLPFVFYVNGKLVLICLNEILIYDIEYGRLSKHIRNTDPMASNFFSCVSVESLVSPRFNRLN